MPRRVERILPILEAMSDPDQHLFMLCRRLDCSALGPLPAGYGFRTCRPDELGAWMDMQFDSAAEAAEQRGFMQSWFDRVYAAQRELFFRTCTFACDPDDRPVATVFAWTTTLGVITVHWLKVLRSHEGLGLGRAVLSRALEPLEAGRYPVLLHTHPTSPRAVGLYASFGFALLSGARLGTRRNDLDASLPILRRDMSRAAFERLTIEAAPAELAERLRGEVEPEF